MIPQVAIPEKLIPVFMGDARYRGSYGGRGSAKTRTFAKMLAVKGVILAEAKETGILVCGREIMKSLDDSSFAEVKAAILSEKWLADRYDIGEQYIRTNDRRISFAFVGLRHNLSSIKSKAKIHCLWIDEAEDISEGAWKIVIPTVREVDSELWVTWNRKKKGSPTDNRFIQDPPKNAKIVEMNWRDNPRFPDVLNQERLEDLEKRPDDYRHVWEGDYEKRSKAAVFNNWRVEEFDSPTNEVYRLGADWGYSVDPTVLIRSRIDGKNIYIDYEAYMVGCEIDMTPDLFDQVPEARRWPIRADSARPETISYMKRHGYPLISAATKGPGSVEDGITFLNSYNIIVHPRCVHTIYELENYKYKVDPLTDEVLPILEDKHNHVIDALRYSAENARKAIAKKKNDYNQQSYTALDDVIGY